MRAVRVLPSVALASGIWYGALVWLGVLAGHNIEAIARVVGEVGGVLLMVAAALAMVLAVWWWRTRHRQAP